MEDRIFISASYYKQKFYENPEYGDMPVEIRSQMKSLCIMLAQKLQCIITLGFYEDGDVFLNAASQEDDYSYDEIGTQLEVKEVEEENKEIFSHMKLWYLMYKTDYGELLRERLTD